MCIIDTGLEAIGENGTIIRTEIRVRLGRNYNPNRVQCMVGADHPDRPL